MRPAEFDTRRRSLGLSVAEVAAFLAVSERAIHRWSTGAYALPINVAEQLALLEDQMLDAVDRALEMATDATIAGPVMLWRYRTEADQATSPHASSLPLGAHAMMISWAADAIEAAGCKVHIEWSEGKTSATD